MLFGANVVLNKCCFEQMLFQGNLVLIKCCFEQMLFWENVVLGKCCFEQMLFWADVVLGKCCFGQMLFWANAVLSKCWSRERSISLYLSYFCKLDPDWPDLTWHDLTWQDLVFLEGPLPLKTVLNLGLHSQQGEWGLDRWPLGPNLFFENHQNTICISLSHRFTDLVEVDQVRSGFIREGLKKRNWLNFPWRGDPPPSTFRGKLFRKFSNKFEWLIILIISASN